MYVASWPGCFCAEKVLSRPCLSWGHSRRFGVERESGCLSTPDIPMLFIRRDVQHQSGSIRFDAQELHDLTPFLGFVGDELGEVRGREREHGTTEVGKPRLHLGIGEAGVDLLVELVD